MQQLDTFQNKDFDRGAPRWKELLWMLVSALCFRHSLAIWNGFKICLLRCFGTKAGKGVLIKPSVHIKFPWKLVVGDHVWIGEKVWIDNLAEVTIDEHVCISQEAYLLTGNHDYKRLSFDLVVRPIRLQAGSWIGARAIVGPGVTVGKGVVLTAGSVATRNLEDKGIYQGNPAVRRGDRLGKS